MYSAGVVYDACRQHFAWQEYIILLGLLFCASVTPVALLLILKYVHIHIHVVTPLAIIR